MALNFNIPKYAYNLPFFIFDIDNKQLITSATIPSDIKDTKDIILSETPIPGQNFQPVTYGGGGNRKISFTLPIIKRNNTVGNILLLKQFENLRNRASGFVNILNNQFQPNPKVLFYWGTGSIPLVYYVKKCDFTHTQNWVNAVGFPQHTMIELELWLDEKHILYKAEEIFRKISSLTGMVTNAYDVIQSQRLGQRPY
jgi:hypothetical protein